jgi:translation initiation factor IF-2
VDIKKMKSKDSKSDTKRDIEIPATLTVGQLGEILNVDPIKVIKNLMRKGVMASINQSIEFEEAATVATDFNYRVYRKAEERGKPALSSVKEDSTTQKPRHPVVTLLGHIDHGKTTLLDAIRETDVVAKESGGITQHIGAYRVRVGDKKITFLDTPGHEAFTAMRARGAQVTDIVVLVVAADDGVMPQTEEAIDHAKAANVPIVVAINKIDKPNANPELVKKQLSEKGLLIEEYGGEVVCVPISAKKRKGIPELLESILVVAEMEDLKANPNCPAAGVIIESKLDASRGPIATVLVQIGTLKVGDNLVVGNTRGRVKAMFDYKGKRVRKAGPSTPVEILGLDNLPKPGEFIKVTKNEREAQILAMKHQDEERKYIGLDRLSAQLREGEIKELPIILKADVQGSIEPIKNSLDHLETEEIRVRIIHSGIGSVTENDVMLAIASEGIIVGFNTHPEPGATRLANASGVDIRLYNVIYDIIDDIKDALQGKLEPKYVEVVKGHATVRDVFSTKGKKVAGAYVSDGKITRGDKARVLRKDEIIEESVLDSLKHFKESVKEINQGFECGVGIEGFSRWEIGDVIEVYQVEKEER